jgi:hypothetical protein
VITGFNTDIPHDGVTYHVQTEDKGLDTPLILSLVYVGGHIIASKRTPYADLISKGFDEQALTERLQRQHKLICAAIKQGRVEDLKRMSGPAQSEAEAAAGGRKGAVTRRKKPDAPAPEETAAPQPESAPQPAPEAAPAVEEPRTPEVPAPPPAPAQTPAAEAPPAGVKAKPEPDIIILSSLADEMGTMDYYRIAPASKETAAPAPEAAAPPAEPVPAEPLLVTEVFEEADDDSDEIYLSLLDDEGEFRAGQLVTIKIYVGRGIYGQRPVGQASLTVKVLGTSFRPLIVTTTTDEHGVGVVRALLPRFNSGRAAIIIRAVAGDDAAEMRRIIHQ